MAKYLLVDDNVAFAENLAEILGDLGDETSVTDNGAHALELAGTTRFDAVISDMRMPGMSGLELVKRLRVVDPALPTLVVTAYSVDADLAEARRRGVLAIMPKPVPLAALLAQLRVARRNGTVAIIDDDHDLVDNLSEILRSHGFTPLSAGSVSELIDSIDVRPFAALVDIRMPGGPDGEALRCLALRFPGLPMFVISGHVEVTLPVEPAQRFAKPFESKALMEALEQLHRDESSTTPPRL